MLCGQVLVDKFISAKLRPHQVVGVSVGLGNGQPRMHAWRDQQLQAAEQGVGALLLGGLCRQDCVFACMVCLARAFTVDTEPGAGHTISLDLLQALTHHRSSSCSSAWRGSRTPTTRAASRATAWGEWRQGAGGKGWEGLWCTHALWHEWLARQDGMGRS